jgi:predicted RNase H-like nuclease (RuvC/YqgF family)
MLHRPVELPDNIPDCHALIIRQAERIEELEARVDELTTQVNKLLAEVRSLKRELYGTRRERFVAKSQII